MNVVKVNDLAKGENMTALDQAVTKNEADITSLRTAMTTNTAVNTALTDAKVDVSTVVAADVGSGDGELTVFAALGLLTSVPAAESWRGFYLKLLQRRALTRPVGHLLPCEVAREKAIISKGFAFSRPKDGRRWTKAGMGFGRRQNCLRLSPSPMSEANGIDTEPPESATQKLFG